jgi:peptidoglycan hydrolase-like protein with peptidoglycan-binding domain
MRLWSTIATVSLLILGAAAANAQDVSGATRLVAEAQRELEALGFDPGAADGIAGAQTRAALRAYQRANHLHETGVLDAETEHALLTTVPLSAARTGRAHTIQVFRAQRELERLGYDPGPIDGEIGPRTRAALSAYQRAYQLVDTGTLDAATSEHLAREPRVAATSGSTSEVLERAQRKLQALGFDPGAADGIFGEQTRAALHAYQRAHRLPRTGTLDERTMEALFGPTWR